MSDDRVICERRPFLKVEDAMKLLNMSDRTVRQLIYDGKLVAHHFAGCLRISPDDMDAFILDSRRVDAGGEE